MRSSVCAPCGHVPCHFPTRERAFILLARGHHTIMSRTLGMAIGVVLFVLFFASIGARFTRPVTAAPAVTTSVR
jgi:hypothetical protein